MDQAKRPRHSMAPAKAVFTRETFQFFKDLSRHNRKEWMDANRDRYQTALVQPFRRLLEELAPTALELDSRFDTSGRTGAKRESSSSAVGASSSSKRRKG